MALRRRHLARAPVDAARPRSSSALTELEGFRRGLRQELRVGLELQHAYGRGLLRKDIDDARVANLPAGCSPRPRTLVREGLCVLGWRARRSARAPGSDVTSKALGEERLPNAQLSLRYRFAHVLYHNVLYSTLASKRRMVLHQRAAEHLLAPQGGDAWRVAAQLAVHFEAGRDYGAPSSS